jgi:hypothetical protein
MHVAYACAKGRTVRNMLLHDCCFFFNEVPADDELEELAALHSPPQLIEEMQVAHLVPRG